MNSKLFTILSIYCLFLFTTANGQKPVSQNAPKVGLCLSGGGAKGLAHIGLLKLIDSLGIKIDYITGTSMGSIVGGLYACGYSGKQIDSLVHTIDWDIVLSESVPLNKILIDEKDEYNRYIAELAVNKKGIKLTGFIEGQSLMDLLTHLTRHVSHIEDFSKLPIPYKCMAVDIETVKPVVLDKGNLALAMRSSMSIPTVFKPTSMNNQVYVDGGLISNFPVQEVQKMGADIIIGSYTGGRLKSEKEMNLFTQLLVQTSSFYAIQLAQEEIKRCHIFNNLTENMKEYEASDFKKSNAILEKGEQVAYNVLPQLVELANQLKQYKALQPKKDLQIEEKQINIKNIYTDTLSFTRTLGFLAKDTKIKQNSVTNYNQIANMIRDIYSTRNVQKASYELEQCDSDTTSYDLHLRTQVEEKWRLKTALHYDSDLGAGIILNLTARNVLGKASRFLATVDLAQNLKIRANYRKYLKNSPISFNTQFLSERTLYKFNNLQGRTTDEYKNNYRYFTVGLNANLNRNMGWYAGFITENADISPRLETSYYIPGVLKRIQSNISGFQSRFTINTLDHPFFPKKGVSFFVEYRRNISTFENIQLQDTTATAISNNYEISGNYSKLQTSLKALLPVTKKLAVLLNSNWGFTGTAKLVFQKLGNTPITTLSNENIYLFSDNFQIGGIIQRARTYAVPFAGIKENDYGAANFAALQIGIQYELIHNLFITPSVNSLYLSSSFKNFPKNPFKRQFVYNQNGYYNTLYTYSLNIGYKTILGPILINIAKSSEYKKLEGYLSIGYNF